jgi:hypothetical protein
MAATIFFRCVTSNPCSHREYTAVLATSSPLISYEIWLNNGNLLLFKTYHIENLNNHFIGGYDIEGDAKLLSEIDEVDLSRVLQELARHKLS